jgi:hypothetical protein
MPSKHDPQQPAPAGAKDAGGLADAARQLQAIKLATDTVLIEELAGRQGQHLHEAPEVLIERELAGRGYVFDADKGTWTKGPGGG